MAIKLVDLDSELWETFRGAYGNVRDEVAILMGEPITEPQMRLRRLDPEEKDDFRIAFDNLFSNLYHQMSFYDATYLVLPYIVTLLEKDSRFESFEWKLLMISETGICLATDIPYNQRDILMDEKYKAILSSYEASVLKLKELTKQFLKQYEEEIKALDFDERSELVTSVLAIFGEREMAFMLALSDWDSWNMLCDNCEDCLEEMEISDDEAKEWIVPAESVIGKWNGFSYEDAWLWISNVLNQIGAQEESEFLSYCYGTYTCSQCGNKKKVLDFMKNYYF